jgi:hypothetical protein
MLVRHTPVCCNAKHMRQHCALELLRSPLTHDYWCWAAHDSSNIDASAAAHIRSVKQYTGRSVLTLDRYTNQGEQHDATDQPI